MVGVGGFKACVGCEVGLPLCFIAVPTLSGCGVVCSSVAGVEVTQSPFPLSACHAPKEAISKASGAHVLTED